MKRTTQEEIKPEFVSTEAMSSMFEGFDIMKIAIKGAIGYAFVTCAYLAAEHAAVTLALLVSPLWLQLVIVFATLAAALSLMCAVTPLVANTVYDAGAYVGSKAVSLFQSAKARVAEFRAPSTATVH